MGKSKTSSHFSHASFPTGQQLVNSLQGWRVTGRVSQSACSSFWVGSAAQTSLFCSKQIETPLPRLGTILFQYNEGIYKVMGLMSRSHFPWSYHTVEAHLSQASRPCSRHQLIPRHAVEIHGPSNMLQLYFQPLFSLFFSVNLIQNQACEREAQGLCQCLTLSFPTKNWGHKESIKPWLPQDITKPRSIHCWLKSLQLNLGIR